MINNRKEHRKGAENKNSGKMFLRGS